MQELIRLANADPLARRWACGASFDMIWGIGDDLYRLCIRDGLISELTATDHRLISWDFAIRGPRAVWQAHWQDPPPPNHHDIIALRTAGAITIEGNLKPFFANILYVKRILELPRFERIEA